MNVLLSPVSKCVKVGKLLAEPTILSYPDHCHGFAEIVVLAKKRPDLGNEPRTLGATLSMVSTTLHPILYSCQWRQPTLFFRETLKPLFHCEATGLDTGLSPGGIIASTPI